MKPITAMSSFDRIGRTVRMPALFSAICLSLTLVACSSSSSPSAPDARLNQHLVYQHQLDKDATAKPYQTVVLHHPAIRDDHLSTTPGSGYHTVPYEISNAGKYKYCIPDNDTHLTRVELFDPAGALAGDWEKGEPCSSVPLSPGRYTMHVHLNTAESAPPVFLKPHDVKVTRTGTMKGTLKSVSSSFDGPIPANQFLSLKVDTLADVLKANLTRGTKEGWGVMTPSSGGYPQLKQLQYHTLYFYDESKSYKVADALLDKVGRIDGSDLFYMNSGQNNQVSVMQGDDPLVVSSGFCLKQHKEQRCDECMEDGPYYTVNVCDQRGSVVALSPSGSGAGSGSSFNFSAAAAGAGFQLSDSTGSSDSPVNWYEQGWATGAGTKHVDFNVRVRYGTTSGFSYPAMLANEVALLDSAYGSSGFADNTRYWIVNADMKDFTEFSFDNPTNRVKSVIAGRGARAQIFQNPNFQGRNVYVSPPMDSEMLMTGTDNALLNDGTVGSIRIEPNSNDIPVNDFEHHIIVSANTCIGCDLRGFDASSLSNASTDWGIVDFVFVGNADFSGSDLSYSNFSLKVKYINNSNFQNVDFTGADLSNDVFTSCNFSNTDFTKAVLNGVVFNNYYPELSFYKACPKFENTDLSTVTGFDSYLRVGNNSGYSADTWWNTQRKLCRTSIANSKVGLNLISDKHLWQFMDAPGADFSALNLDGAVFAGSSLRRASFRNASLKDAVFVQADLTGTDVSGADLTGAHLEGAALDGVNLYKAVSASKAVLSGVSIKALNLASLDMSGAQLKAGEYTNWDGHKFEQFGVASISGAYMYNTKLNGADLTGAYLDKVSWFGDQATGENAIMVNTHFEKADMPGLKLIKAHLQGANFTDAELVNADLSTINSPEYSFVGTTFINANLKGANLSGANLRGSNLEGAITYAGAGQQNTYIEVLDDPTTNQGYYKYYPQAYSATIPPASTDGIINCPSGTRSSSVNCGDMSSAYWSRSTLAPVLEPDCILRKAQQGETGDDNGMVLVCTSHRHPAAPTGITATSPAGTLRVVLNWNASPVAVRYGIYRDTIPLQAVTEVTAQDETVSANTEYCYTVTTFDGSGNESAQPAAVCITTPAAPP